MFGHAQAVQRQEGFAACDLRRSLRQDGERIERRPGQFHARRRPADERGYVGKQRNTVTVNGEWLANTTMQKTLAGNATPGVPT